MWAALIASVCWLFYPGLVFSEVPAFRDAYHFYYPQIVWLDQCAARGELFPVWNANEGLGVSVSGQPSAGLYYPLRILLLLPGMSVAQRLSLFLVIHLLLAAAGMRLAVRSLGLSRSAGWVAAVSFTLGCPVFFQHSNLIFLLSASWVGFALAAVFSFTRYTCHYDKSSQFAKRDGSSELSRNPQSGSTPQPTSVSLPSCGMLSVACSLMVLAGDPHTCANTLIIAGIATTCWLWRDWRYWARACTWGGAAIAIIVALTAVQWIPAWRWSQHSQRAEQSVVDTTELISDLDPLLEDSRPAGHRIYDFSLSPWHLVTGLWPTLGGHYLPTQGRLFAAIPAEGRMWVPSIYIGCLPGLWALLMVFRWRRWRRGGLLICLFFFCLLAAMGNYSIVWLVRELLLSLGLSGAVEGLPKDHVGSVYWLLANIFPYYDMFRYPAKWTVWMAAMASLLAALYWDTARLDNADLGTACLRTGVVPRRLRQLVMVVSLFGLAFALVVWQFAAWSETQPGVWGIDAWLAAQRSDVWFGPPNTRAISLAVCIAFAVPLCVLVVVKATRGFYGVWTLTLVELTICAASWISFVPAPKPLSDAVGGLPSSPRVSLNEPVADEFLWANTARAAFSADESTLAADSFVQRQADYQQVFLLGKLAGTAGVRCLGASQSIEPAAVSALRSWLMAHDDLLQNATDVDRVLRQLGVTHRLVRGAKSPHAFAWREIRGTSSLCEFKSATHTGDAQANMPAVSWQWESSSRLKIALDATSPGMLVVRQFNDGGWRATTDSGQPLRIERQSLFIKISVESGSSRPATIQLVRRWGW